MKKIIVKQLNESSNLTALEKMQLFDSGQRNENLKACSDQKIRDYFKICVDNKLLVAGQKLFDEAVRRGLVKKADVCLSTITLEKSDFLESMAKEVFNDIDKLIKKLERINRNEDQNIDISNLSTTQATQLMVDYVVYLIWAIILQCEKDKINTILKLCTTLPVAKVDNEQIKSCINQVASNEEIVSAINDIANKFGVKVDESLLEAIEIHKQLNPKLWDKNKKLKREVRNKILKIVETFKKQLRDDEIKIIIEDIKIVGSNCSYNYSKDSDLDIHIVSNTEKLKNEDNLYPIIYDNYKSIFNNKYELNFYGIPVEIYVETSDTILKEDRKPSALRSCGAYSVLEDKWIKEPVVENIPEIDTKKVDAEVDKWVNKINKIKEKASIKEIEKLFEELYKMRRKSLDQDGEFGLGNLIFKELRNNSYLDDLKDLKHKLISEELSLK